MNNKFIPIQSILDINDNTRIWYSIPGYSGYEISNDYYVRSMKHFRKYPFGLLIKPINKDNSNIRFELSNNQNERVRISLYDIIELVKNNKNYNYPRLTRNINLGSRNQSICIKPKSVEQFDNTPRPPKFTIIKNS